MWFILIAIISFIFKRRSMKRSRENNRNNTNTQNTPNDRKLYSMLVYFVIFDIIQYNIRGSLKLQFIKYIIFYTVFLNNPTFSQFSFPKFNITNKSYLIYWVINGIRDTLLFLKFIAFTAILNLVKTVVNFISIFMEVAYEFRKKLRGARQVTITERLSTPEKLDFGHSKNACSGANTNTHADKYPINTSKLENIENLNQMQDQLKNNLNTQSQDRATQKEIENKLIDKEITSKLEELEQIRYELRMRKFKLLELAAKLEEY